MERRICLTLPDNEEFTELLKNYEKARNDLQTYLWKEDLIAKEKAASSD